MVALTCTAAGADPGWVGLRLDYDQPAVEWTDALPVGNGSLGAMVFGGITEERIQLNHDTLWAGHPRSYSTPKAGHTLSRLRQLLFDGNQKEAEALAMEQFMSEPLRQAPYQPLGDLVLEFPDLESATRYRRTLDLDGAVATTTLTGAGVTYTRSVFASYPDGVLVVRIEADQPGKVDVKARLSTPHGKARVTERFDGRTLRLNGVVDDFTSARRTTPLEGTVEFEVRLRVESEGGRATVGEERIEVRGADAVVFRLAAATSYA
jgi:alpha-L-fucosidase 2